MLATPGALPLSAQWAYELKWDGIRMLVTCTAGSAVLTSRNGVDHTARWPEVGPVAASLPPGRTVLDGELVAFDEAGRPSFSILMAARGRAPGVATLCVFDVPVLDGQDLTGRPWQERRRALEGLGLQGVGWRTPDTFDDGSALLAATATQGLEGVVAKRRSSPYRPGVRSRDWVKVAHRRTTSVVVGGWQPGGADGVRSLVVGVPIEGDRLEPLGSVGSGLSGAEVAALLPVLAQLDVAVSPFDPAPDLAAAHWVEPLLVVDVEHLGHTQGRQLRQPVFVRVRPDLTATDLISSEEGEL
jgi:bifunctional non-homologous end joining protein LigD